MGYLLSSFENWDDVAHSYVQRARPKASVTPAVRELSNRLAAGQTSVRDQARAIHEWVATQVGYAGNCVGIGAVVPCDLDVVLQHRLGDCKDHATLLQALLAAQGIESHQVLVNAGNLYRLPEVPVASLVNHVLSDDPKVPRRIPVDPGSNAQTMKTALVIEEDGSVQGRIDIELSGLYALNGRARFRRMEAQQRKDFVKDMYRRANLQAEGTLELDDPAPLTDTFHLAGTFRVAKAMGFPGTGGLAVGPRFYNEAPAIRWAQQAAIPLEDVESVCSAGRSVEEYDITLPASMRVVAVPDPIAINSPLLGYEASYKLDGRRLTVRRVIEDRTRPGICSAALMRDFREAVQVVLRDVRQQLLYR